MATLLLAACGHHGDTRSTTLTTDTLRHATLLTCQRGEGYSLWTLRDPWDTTAILHQYLLVSDTAAQPDISAFHSPLGACGASLCEEFSTIKVPVRRAGVATAVHCGLIDELGCGDAIVGVCEKQYIDLPVVSQGLANGSIADFGNGMNPNIECIMDVAPDVLLLTPFEHSGGYGRVERLDIPIVECAEYMETSPLARAEWIRFYGELFGVETVADSIFSTVEQNYNALCSLAVTSAERPRILSELPYGGQWFVPCGGSTMGIMYRDAAAEYVFADREGSGSVALAFESVLDAAGEADVWLIKYNSSQPLTYKQLAADFQPYTLFRAWQQRHIFGCDLAHSHFYEQTPFHPDHLLRDIIAILHPELLPGYETVYFHSLEP